MQENLCNLLIIQVFGAICDTRNWLCKKKSIKKITSRLAPQGKNSNHKYRWQVNFLNHQFYNKITKMPLLFSYAADHVAWIFVLANQEYKRFEVLKMTELWVSKQNERRQINYNFLRTLFKQNVHLEVEQFTTIIHGLLLINITLWKY